jgi:hypothetical protein
MSEIMILVMEMEVEVEVEVEENQLNYLVVEKANAQLRHACCVAYSPMVKNAQFEQASIRSELGAVRAINDYIHDRKRTLTIFERVMKPQFRRLTRRPRDVRRKTGG